MRLRCAATVAAFFAVAAWIAPATAEPPERVRVQASVSCPLSPVPPTDIRIESDGAMVVRQRRRTDAEPRTVLEMRLTDSELTELREKIVEARFFDDWTRGGMATDLPTWNVTAELGERRKSRPEIYGQPQFDPFERFLWRVVDQAQAVEEIRGGGAVGVASGLVAPSGRARFIRPDLVAAEVAAALPAALVAAKQPYDAAVAARLLIEILPPPVWERAVPEILAKLEGDRRDEALRAWAAAVGEPGHAAQRTAFASVAVAEVRSSWHDWGSLGDRREQTLRELLAAALRERSPDAVAVAEEMMRSLSTSDRPFVAPGLHLLGADAVSVALRLLGGATAEARAAGAALAERLARVVKVPPRDNLLPLEMRAALEKRLTAELLPAVDVRAGDPGEALFVREACFRALDAWNGRDRWAEERARRAEASKKREAAEAADREAAAARRAQIEPSQPSTGVLSVAGRLVGAADAALAGFTVIAFRNDGPPDDPFRVHGSATTAADGSFRIGGLVEAEFTLIATPAARWGPRDLAANASARGGVRAGSSDVALRFPGSMLRGRVVDESGRPVARQALRARMRNSPNHIDGPELSPTASAETAADGRFWMLQLLPGVWDIELPMRAFVTGATGVAAGPEELTIVVRAGASITGRVLDERGMLLLGFAVGAAPVISPAAFVGGRVDEFGRFSIDGLDPAMTYDVVASFSDRGRDLNYSRDAREFAVMPGAGDLMLRIDTGPRVELRVDFGRRAPTSGAVVRLTRVDAGASDQREFKSPWIDWRMAPQATWRVSAKVRDVDGRGDAVDVWIELGTVKTGDPATTFAVPR